MLLVEQNARAALCIADHGYVIETVKIGVSGTCAELLPRRLGAGSFFGPVL